VQVEEKMMSFWDHLDDLRKSLINIIVALICVATVLFVFKDFLFEDVVLAPSRQDFIFYRFTGIDMSLPLVNLEVAAQFVIHLKVTFIAALILACPYIIYELWRFIAPALYVDEKKAVRKAFMYASVLFYVGLAVGYFIVLPLMLNFFADYQVSASVPNTFSLSSYISLLTSTVLAFGIVFEFPAVVAVLSAMGIVTRENMIAYRKYAVCGVLVLAAIITPSGDPFSLLICSVPLYLLYEFSILLCCRGDKLAE